MKPLIIQNRFMKPTYKTLCFEGEGGVGTGPGLEQLMRNFLQGGRAQKSDR